MLELALFQPVRARTASSPVITRPSPQVAPTSSSSQHVDVLPESRDHLQPSQDSRALAGFGNLGQGRAAGPLPLQELGQTGSLLLAAQAASGLHAALDLSPPRPPFAGQQWNNIRSREAHKDKMPPSPREQANHTRRRRPPTPPPPRRQRPRPPPRPN